MSQNNEAAKQSRAYARVAGVAEEIANEHDIPLPRLVLSCTVGPESRCLSPGQYALVYPARPARREPELVLRGAVAHELAHIEYGDPYRLSRIERLSQIAKLTGVVLVALAISATLATGVEALARQLGSGPASIILARRITALITFVVPVIVGTFWLNRRWLATSTAAGRDRPLLEVRADLRSVQLVGSTAALARLRHRHRGWRRWWRRADAWLSRYTGSTHPSDHLRQAALQAYDPGEDPGTAAQRVLACARQESCGCTGTRIR